MPPRYSPVGPPTDTRPEDQTPTQESGTNDVPGEKNEGGKVIVLGAWARLWTLSVHFLPLTATIILLYVNHTRRFWFEHDIAQGGAPDEILNTLQFAAKVHELLVILSLGAVTLKVFKRRLIGSAGLPLGLVTGSYRVGDVPYIFSLGFLRVLWSPHVWLALLLFVNTMIATLVGPASAILMLPSENWFPFPNAFGELQNPIFYTRPPNETWPRVLAGEDVDPDLHGCLDADKPAYWCPGSGYQELWNWVASWQVTGLSDSLSVSNPAGGARRDITVIPPQHYLYVRNAGKPPIMAFLAPTLATTTSMPTLLTLTRFLNHVEFAPTDAFGDQGPRVNNVGALSNSTSFRVQTTDEPGMFRPLVQTACKLYRADDLAEDDPERFPYFPTDTLDCFEDAGCHEALAAAKDMFPPARIWGRLPRNHTAWQVNLQAPRANSTAAKHPVLVSGVLPYLNNTAVRRWVFACTVLAHWVPAGPIRVSLDQAEELQEIRSTQDVARQGAYMAHMTDAWLPYLDMAPTLSQEPGVVAGNHTSNTLITDDDAPGNDTPFRAQPAGTLSRLLRIASRTIRNPSGHGSTANSTIAVFDPGSSLTTTITPPADPASPGPGTTPDVAMWYSATGFLERLVGAAFVDGLARAASRGASVAKTAQNDTAVAVADLGVQQGLDAGAAGEVVYSWDGDAGGIRSHGGSVDTVGAAPAAPILRVPAGATADDARALFGAVTPVPLRAERYGYGFGNPSHTLNFALAVMYVYLFVLAAYLASVVRSFLGCAGAQETAETVAAWGDVHDVLVLAWKSEREPALGGSNTWLFPTRIRADVTGRVQLVGEDRAGAGGMKRLKRGVPYR